jgi:DNA polymerase-3 subunit delta'
MSGYGANWGIIGHGWAVDLLTRRTATGDSGHAYLFTGPSQIGKRTLALRLAQVVNCTGDVPPCGVCRNCDLIARGLHSDIQFIKADGKTIKIEAVRDLQHDLSLRPVEARSRIALIRNIQDATDQAQDALLKTLEEPAATSRLILTADDPGHLLPTIVSRCKVIALRPVAPAAIAEGLIAQVEVPAEQAHTLARLSGGRPGWAINAARDPAILEERAAILDALIGLLQSDRATRFAYSDEISHSGALDLILDTWQSWWRDVLLLAEGSEVPPANADYLDTLQNIAGSIVSGDARTAIRAVRRTVDALGKNANTRLALEVLMLDWPYL